MKNNKNHQNQHINIKNDIKNQVSKTRVEPKIHNLITALEKSVSTYHSVSFAKEKLETHGFEKLELEKPFKLEKGKSYYIDIFDSSFIAFNIGKNISEINLPNLRIIAGHLDWPCLKLKPNPEIIDGKYGKLNVEVYGGPILSTWFDRPLGLGGKICLKTSNPFKPKTVIYKSKKSIGTIPNLAIHLNRNVNEGFPINNQIDLPPLCEIIQDKLEEKDFLIEHIANELEVQKTDILDYELFIYNLDKPEIVGLKEEFLSSPRIDNISSLSAGLFAIENSINEDNINLISFYDNEEIGSLTKQGAKSTVTEKILEKIFIALGYDREEFLDILLNSIMLSIDGAHSIHPNHKEKSDIKNQIYLGDGLAIKIAANQAYATDSFTISIIESLCINNDIPYKKFSNRSDIKGGSTLGSISSSLLGIKAVDIGIPILAMHSARELVSVSDQLAIEKLALSFFDQ